MFIPASFLVQVSHITESLSKKRHNKKIERVMSIDNQNYVDSKSQANSTFSEMKTQNVA